MRENIARIAIATTIGVGAWFAGNCEYQKSGRKLETPIASQGSLLNGQSSKGESGLDPRTPEMVSRVNAAIALLGACSDPAARDAATKFITLNTNSKIALAYGSEIGENALGVMIIAGDKDNFISQVGISPQSLLDSQLSDQEIGRQMFKAVYIVEAIKNSPARYDKDQDFRNLIDYQADQRASEAFCAK